MASDLKSDLCSYDGVPTTSQCLTDGQSSCRRLESDPLKVGIFWGPLPKNKTLLKDLRCFLDAKLNLDHDFVIEIGLT